MAERNGNGERRPGIRYRAGDGRSYTSADEPVSAVRTNASARSVFADMGIRGDSVFSDSQTSSAYAFHGNAATPLYTDPAAAEPEAPQEEPVRRQENQLLKWLRGSASEQQFRRNMILACVSGLATLFVITSVMLGLSANYNAVVQEIAEVNEIISIREQENEALKTQIELMFSKREVEMFAENTLHMVKANLFNTVGITLSGGNAALAPGSAAAHMPLRESPLQDAADDGAQDGQAVVGYYGAAPVFGGAGELPGSADGVLPVAAAGDEIPETPAADNVIPETPAADSGIPEAPAAYDGGMIADAQG